jgi:hypothetical protein
VLLRRVVVAPFTPRRPGLVRVFLASRCAGPATGCRTASPCTVRALCEERGETCGDQGTCVPHVVEPTPDLDAGFGDVAPPPTCGRPGEACCVIGAPCMGALECVAGTCSACPAGSEACCEGGSARADGTVCAMASGGCMRDGVCNAGVCTGTTPLPDGTVCAMAGNPCQRNGVCRGGVCSGTTPAPDGTVCAPQNTAACDAARVCSGGTCQPAAPLPDGTVCRAASNACELAARCSGGSCPANPRRPNNYVLSSESCCMTFGDTCACPMVVTAPGSFTRDYCGATNDVSDVTCGVSNSADHVYLVRLTTRSTVTVSVTGGATEVDILYRGTNCPGVASGCTQHNAPFSRTLGPGDHYFALEDDHAGCRGPYTVTFAF